MPKVLGIGQPLIDKIYQIKDDHLSILKIEKKGGSILYKDYKLFKQFCEQLNEIQPEFSIVPGGSCSNTLKGISSLGESCGLIGKVGKNDEMGRKYISSMEERKVTSLMSFSETPTGECICLITPDGERTMRVFLGSSEEMSEKDLDIEHFKGIELFHIEGYALYNQPLTLKALEYAKKVNAKVSYDLGSFELAKNYKNFIIDTILKDVDILFCNEEEAKEFGSTPKESLDLISKHCEIVVIMLGPKGCLIKKGNNYYEVKGIPLKPHEIKDTTGAGDLFISGFLYALLQGYDIEKCAKLGCLTGREVCQVQGAEIKNESWDEIKRKLKE